jgi:hypothetical protein
MQGIRGCREVREEDLNREGEAGLLHCVSTDEISAATSQTSARNLQELAVQSSKIGGEKWRGRAGEQRGKKCGGACGSGACGGEWQWSGRFQEKKKGVTVGGRRGT